MKAIEVFVIGKYEYKTKVGVWIYYLNYKDAVVKRSGTINNAGSPARTALYALYKSLERINEPCNILVHSKANLGFKNPKASVNKDIIMKILQAINRAGHTVAFDATDDFSRVEQWENRYGNKTDAVRKQNSKPVDIKGKTNPNDVFNRDEQYTDEYIKEQAMKSADWRLMYSDLMGPSEGTWVQGSGGY